MTELFATVGDQRARTMRLQVPNIGAWILDAELDDGTALPTATQVDAKLGALTLRGTVLDSFSGSFALARRIRMVGGAGGWDREIPAKPYHNDAAIGGSVGVRALEVLKDAAREAGETLVGTPPAERAGPDYVRRAGPACRVFDDVLRTPTPWWVEYDGVTHVGARPAKEVVGSYDLLNYDPGDNVATLALDDPTVVGIGSVLRGRLDAPATVRELELVLDSGKLRAYAWCGGAAATEGRLLRAIRAIVRGLTARYRFHGLYRYRVVNMSVDRVELQAIRKLARLPDILPVTMFPGVSGAWAKLRPGATVLVTFIEGDPTLPIVTHFEPKGGDGFVPLELLVDAKDKMELGPSCALIKVAGGGPAAARTDDATADGSISVASVDASGVRTITFTYTPQGGAPTPWFTLTGTAANMPALAPNPASVAILGKITGGSAKTQVG